jgi:hypothetical protein
MTFKKGDTVKCIDTSGNSNRYLSLGTIYKVVKTDIMGFVYLEGPAGGGWFPKRFELVGFDTIDPNE